ncbi:MAG TPA: ABC transporter ATP-binding protein [Candidatus Bathyarchaeota archaeon]|nr:ABC transporter ATP-binding protein [Candidatus Bathyarchaeota archaeon]
MPRVELKDITVRYGRLEALKEVNLVVEDGSYTVIAGPTGAGKTTLLKVIAGLVKPSHGSVIVDGKDYTMLPPEDRNVGYLPQGYALFPHLTVWENVTFGAYCRGWSPEETEEVARRVLNMVGLIGRAESYPGELSGGMAQRTALARAIASGASLILFDEPLSALDLMLRLILRYEIRRMVKSLGLTVIHVTHDHEEAMSIADKIYLLRSGEIVESGTPEELYMRPRDPFTAYFIGESNLYRGVLKDGRVQVGGLELDTAFDDYDGEVLVALRTRRLFPGVKLDNTFEASVAEVRFLGRYSRIILESHDLKFTVEAPTVKIGWIRKGETVDVGVKREDVLVYPYKYALKYPEILEAVGNA